jgi:MFS superfamily sulfate permease-like transporter
MQLAVGPTALVSLLTGTLVNKYGASPGSQDALDVATQAALCVGILTVIMSFLNLGSLIQYVPNPVMNGFVTGAAFTIGQQQIRSFFGFNNKPPQVGQVGFDYGYQVMQWYTEHWNDHFQINVGTKKAPKYIYKTAKNYYAISVRLFFY